MKPRRQDCFRVSAAIPIGCGLANPAWAQLPWSEEFVDISGDPTRPPRFRTRMKTGWDETYLYVGAMLDEPHVWGTLREMNARLCEENAFELFLDPDGDGQNYYELEVNALGTIWELSLDKPYRDGGVATSGCNLPGLRRAVRVDGTLDDPTDTDVGWTVELALPWAEIARFNRDRSSPPRDGDEWRANFARVEWRHEVVDGRYRRVPPHGTPRRPGPHPGDDARPEDYWVWSAQGAVNMHLPDRWGALVFRDRPAPESRPLPG